MESLRPVICALEDTDVARHAAAASSWLARDLRAPLVLAHVFDPDGIGVRPLREMAAASMYDEDLESHARQAAGRLVEETARGVGGDVTTALPEDRPVPGLLQLAAARDARLVVTGTAARAGLDLALIGSVTSELAARAPCPVVAVPPEAALEEPGPVVAGYDGSEHSLRAARHAAALAAQLERDMVLVHAAGDRDEGVRPDTKLADELFAAAVDALGKKPGRQQLDLNVSLAVEEGDAVKTIARVCRERAAALVVTGTRGRNVLTSALLGSVSAGLVHAAERPVVLVPARAGDRLR
ncbi:MAG: universal stress protein [Thermoleophilaceae bacterium]